MPAIYDGTRQYIETRYTSASSGWIAQNGVGTAAISGGLSLSMASGQNASNLYPDGNNPRYYRDVSSDIASVMDWEIWIRIVSATLHANSRAGISIGDSSDSTTWGANLGFSTVCEIFCGNFSNSVGGAPSNSIALDGTGWVGFSCRGGIISGIGGIGTTSTPPSVFAAVGRNLASNTGQGRVSRLSLYGIKWSGGDTNVVYQDIIIRKY